MNKKRLISSAVSGAILLSSAAPAISAYSAEGRLYNQRDPQWKDVKFTKYSLTQNNMYDSGCGIFSFCNLIYAMNGIVADPVEVGTWAVGNGSYMPGAGGLYRYPFYNNVEKEYGERFNFKVLGQYYGKVTDPRFIEHIKNGGYAIIHVYNHMMAITGYDPANETYHVLESFAYGGRALQADSWVPVKKMCTDLTAVDWYALIDKAKRTPSITVNCGSAPKGNCRKGTDIGIYGDVDSELPIKKIWGGVYRRNGEKTEQYAEYSPYLRNFDLHAGFSDSVKLSKLPEGDYIYKIQASDTQDNTFTLEESEFTICDKEISVTLDGNGGDISQSSINVSSDGEYSSLADVTAERGSYVFDGWFTEKQGGSEVNEFTEVTENKDHTLYAHWADRKSPSILTSEVTDIFQDWFRVCSTADDECGVKGMKVSIVTPDDPENTVRTLDCTNYNGVWVCDIDVSDINSSFGKYFYTVSAEDMNGNITRSDMNEVSIGGINCFLHPNGGKADREKIYLYEGQCYGDDGSLPVPEMSGYLFKGWYNDAYSGEKVNDLTPVTADNDHYIYARWQEKEKTVIKYVEVIHKTSDGFTLKIKVPESDSITSVYADIEAGGTEKRIDAAKNGDFWYCKVSREDFDNYSGEYACSLYITDIFGESYLSEYADVIAGTVECELDANGGSCAQTSRTILAGHKYGETVPLPVPVRNNYTFKGWFTAPEGGKKVTDNDVITSDTTLFAHWDVKSCNISFEANGGETDAEDITAEVGTTYGTLPVPSREGYSFTGWFTEKKGGREIIADDIIESDGKQTLYAHWADRTAPEINEIEVTEPTLKGFDVLISAEDGAGLRDVSVEVHSWRGRETDGIIIPAEQNGDKWVCSIDLSEFNNTCGTYYFSVSAADINGNRKISPEGELTIGEINCTFNAMGGTVDQDSKILRYGLPYSQDGALPKPVKEGYIFDGWFTDLDNGTIVTDAQKVKEEKDITLYARWYYDVTYKTTALSQTGTTTSSAQTTVSTTVSTTTTTAAPAVTYQWGDVNQDGFVDGRDASAVLTEYAKSSAGSSTALTDEQRKVYDVNSDNIIDGRDASLLLSYYAQYSVGKVSSHEEFLQKYLSNKK